MGLGSNAGRFHSVRIGTAGLRVWERGSLSLFHSLALRARSIVRGLGPLGKKLVVGYTQRRFVTGNHLSEEEVAALSECVHSTTLGRSIARSP